MLVGSLRSLMGANDTTDSNMITHNFHNQSFRSSKTGTHFQQETPSPGMGNSSTPSDLPNLTKNVSEASRVTAPSPTQEEYLQDKSFVTQSYVDLRYITGEVRASRQTTSTINDDFAMYAIIVIHVAHRYSTRSYQCFRDRNSSGCWASC